MTTDSRGPETRLRRRERWDHIAVTKDGDNRLIGEIDRSILMHALDTRGPGAEADTNGETDAR